MRSELGKIIRIPLGSRAICAYCGKESESKYAYICDGCLKIKTPKNAEAMARNNAYRKAGICMRCRRESASEGHSYCERCMKNRREGEFGLGRDDYLPYAKSEPAEFDSKRIVKHRWTAAESYTAIRLWLEARILKAFRDAGGISERANGMRVVESENFRWIPVMEDSGRIGCIWADKNGAIFGYRVDSGGRNG